MRWEDYIEALTAVMMGKPVFKGTRITVEHVLEELDGAVSEEELLRGHHRLTPEHIRAAFLYAAAVIGLHKSIF